MGDREQAMEYVEQAIRVADNQEDMVSAMQYKAYMRSMRNVSMAATR